MTKTADPQNDLKFTGFPGSTKRYRQGSRPDIRVPVREVALSPFHFVRAFRQSTGLTPHRYVRGRRLERARDLIVSGTLIRDVAARVGYESLSHFHAAYRAHFGADCDPPALPARRRPGAG